MADEKLELLLNAALEATPGEREKSEILNVGFDTEKKTWEVIVKYHGDLLFWKSYLFGWNYCWRAMPYCLCRRMR